MKPQSPVLLPSLNRVFSAREALDQERVFAKDQPQFRPLPALVSRSIERRVTSRWKLSWRERIGVLYSGNVYLQQLTYGHPLQAVLLTVEQPKPEEVL